MKCSCFIRVALTRRCFRSPPSSCMLGQDRSSPASPSPPSYGASVIPSSTQADQLQALCNQGQLDKALDVVSRMDQAGIVPSVAMYRSLLRACGKRKALAQAQRVRKLLAKHGSVLGEYEVSTLVKCGGLDDALQLFRRLPRRSVFSWTAVISGYTMMGRGQEALRMYGLMQEDGVRPDAHTFATLLKACASVADLDEGRRIHADALTHGCADSFVGTCLVDMYAKCGSIVEATNVFHSLSQPNVVSCNVMLSAYSLQDQPETALQLFDQMREEGLSPDDRTFVSALQACGMLAEKAADSSKPELLQKAKEIHAAAKKKGYDSDIFVGSTLVSTYGKLGSIVDAQDAFDPLSQRDVVSWNAIIMAYVEHGEVDRVLELYEQMQRDRVSPNRRTFVSVLQACATLAEQGEHVVMNGQPTKLKSKSLERGKQVHADAKRKGYDSDVFVGSTLVSMYSKCGSIVEAQDAFHALSHRNVVSWNAIISAYTKHDKAEVALQLYEQMANEGVSPNARTFVSLLQACGMLAEKEDVVHGGFTKVKSLEKGTVIHADVRSKGFESDAYVSNTLVSMYGKCGSIVEAQNVFDTSSHCDVVAWTALLAAYVEQGQAEKALQLYEQMSGEGIISPDARTFVSVIQACGMLSDSVKQPDLVSGTDPRVVKCIEKGKAIHADILKKGCSSDVFVGNALISMYGNCGSISDAQDVFEQLSQRDVVSWNAMLAVYIQQGAAEKALEVYEQMQGEHVVPDAWTFVSALQACGLLAEKVPDVVIGLCTTEKSLERGRAIHADAWRMGYEADVILGRTLISTYGRCGSIADAENVFAGLSKRRNVVSWNAMLAAYVGRGEGEKALDLCKRMQSEDMSPDEITLLCMLQACSIIGSLQILKQNHATFISHRKNLSPLLASALIDAYGRCASMWDAQAVFEELPQPDVVSWTALIAGYARQGDCAASLQSYEKMLLEGVRPNGVTFLSLLYACSHAGLVDEGVEYFESMSRDHGVIPKIEHYVSLVDLLGRAGCFAKVEELLSTMPVAPDLALWLCLLAACRKHGKVELGKQAFNHAVSLQPKHAAACVLMSNIYADAGFTDQAKQVRETVGCWKKPGQSWIEHGEEVHTFLVGDCKHNWQLYDFLGRTSSNVRKGGHISHSVAGTLETTNESFVWPFRESGRCTLA